MNFLLVSFDTLNLNCVREGKGAPRNRKFLSGKNEFIARLQLY